MRESTYVLFQIRTIVQCTLYTIVLQGCVTKVIDTCDKTPAVRLLDHQTGKQNFGSQTIVDAKTQQRATALLQF